MRYAIWAAVSTEAQAASDKVSLAVQEETCRAEANKKEWTESAGPFIAPGESRTKYIDLTVAAAHIPALHQLILAAERHQFDVLVLYDTNRLRDLYIPLNTYLGNLGINIYSINQPVEPSESGVITDTHIVMAGMQDIISKLQIRDLTRKFKTSMPRRIADRGLPFRIPYGYRKPFGHETDSSAVPIQDSRAAVVVQIKDRYLAGQSLLQIIEWLKEEDILSPGGSQRWHSTTISNILSNPFYCGVVRFGVIKTRRDYRTGKQVRVERVPDKQVIKGIGKHQPLWDEHTYHEICAEMKRRGKRYAGRRTSVLTGLLKCGVCGYPMWIWSHHIERKTDKIYRCSGKPGHPHIRHGEAVRKLGAILTELAQKYPVTELPPAPEDMIDRQARLADLQNRLNNLKEGFIAGIFDRLEYARRSEKIVEQIGELQAQIDGDKEIQEEQQSRVDIINQLIQMDEKFSTWMLEGDPQLVNRMLHLVIKQIFLLEDGRLRVELK